MTADAAIDRFLAAAEAAGVARPARPGSSEAAALAELEAAVAPLRLPAAVRRLWERVDAGALELALVPDLCSPAFALESWRSHEERPGMVPRPLLPLCYSSWRFLLVELHGPDDEQGATVYGWGYDGGDFAVVFDDVEDWLDVVADALDAGAAEPGPDGLVLDLGEAGFDGAVRLRRRGPHPLHGRATSVPSAAVDWPERWLRLSDLTDADRLPQGATHTVAEARAALAGDVAPVRVHARVRHVDTEPDDVRAAIADDSGTLVVACPPPASAFGPVLGERFEFELVAAESDGGTTDGGLLHRTARRLRPAHGPAQATARAIRPLGR